MRTTWFTGGWSPYWPNWRPAALALPDPPCHYWRLTRALVNAGMTLDCLFSFTQKVTSEAPRE